MNPVKPCSAGTLSALLNQAMCVTGRVAGVSHWAFSANLRGKRGPLGATFEIRKGSHTTTPGPSLAKEGSSHRACNPIQRDRKSEKVTSMFV